LRADVLYVTNSCGRFIATPGTYIIGSIIVSANLDADGDGIPNAWELAYGFDRLNPADANQDSDGDGFTNLQEYQAGTDPSNSASFLGITSITPVSSDILITWKTGIGKTNALERGSGASGSYSNNFTTIFTVTNAVGTTTNYLDLGAATNSPALYYRVRLVP